jgi:hypothetical protein
VSGRLASPIYKIVALPVLARSDRTGAKASAAIRTDIVQEQRFQAEKPPVIAGCPHLCFPRLPALALRTGQFGAVAVRCNDYRRSPGVQQALERLPAIHPYGIQGSDSILTSAGRRPKQVCD